MSQEIYNKQLPGGYWVTNDYSMFKFILGNREIKEKHHKLEASYEMYGQKQYPITVNEKYEIIEGQHRFVFFRDKELPIYYIVVPGLTIDDCTLMNTTGEAWKINDHIHKNAVLGNKSYQRFEDLLSKGITKQIICAILFRTSSPNNNVIKDGKFEMSAEQYQKVILEYNQVVSYWNQLDKHIQKKLNPRRNNFLLAFVFIKEYPKFKKDRLITSMNNYILENLGKWNSVGSYISVIEKVYNTKNQLRNKVNFVKDYEDERHLGFSTRSKQSKASVHIPSVAIRAKHLADMENRRNRSNQEQLQPIDL